MFTPRPTRSSLLLPIAAPVKENTRDKKENTRNKNEKKEIKKKRIHRSDLKGMTSRCHNVGG